MQLSGPETNPYLHRNLIYDKVDIEDYFYSLYFQVNTSELFFSL